MEKCKFTPGPWFLSGVRFRMNGSQWHAVNRYDADAKLDQNIACVGFDPRNGDGLADARLIAEAPNMHEALSGLLEQWKEFQASSGNMEEAYYKLAKYARPHWEKAAAALSKANGESGT